MAVRLLAYVGLLYQDLIRHGLAGGALPPVLQIVIYSGERTWTVAAEMAQLIEPMPPTLRRYSGRTDFDAAQLPF